MPLALLRGNNIISDSISARLTGTLVPEVFLGPRREPRSGEDESRRGEKRKTSGYLGLESHFQAVARVRI